MVCYVFCIRNLYIYLVYDSKLKKRRNSYIFENFDIVYNNYKFKIFFKVLDDKDVNYNWKLDFKRIFEDLFFLVDKKFLRC